MRLLTVNCGSSSLKCAIVTNDKRTLDINVERIGDTQATIRVNGDSPVAVAVVDHAAAVRHILDRLPCSGATVDADAVVHRIVHGGQHFVRPTLITDETVGSLAALSELAPLHNPPAIAALRLLRDALPDLPHVAVFDTAFHTTLPPRSRDYALPAAVRERYGIRRYGFHGLSHSHVMQAVSHAMRMTPQQLRIISCHLGNGASITAIEYGRSVETSMGMTPLEGLIMGSRSGDVDPGVVIRLLQSGDYDAAALDSLLNTQSGMRGLTGTNDEAEIEKRAAAGDESCRRAIAMYAHRVRKYIGAYAATMGGVDAIAFTGGVGEHSALLRDRILQRLDFLGARLDPGLNRSASVDGTCPLTQISARTARVAIFVVHADEESVMARAAQELLSKRNSGDDGHIPIGISARHAHLAQATIDQLFGAGYQLSARTELSQPGQFSAHETVTLIGPRGHIDNVRLLGPPRHDDQIEISRSDEFILGIDAPVRLSGDLQNTPGAILEGPRGNVSIPHGVICARRHIHMSPADAQRFDLTDHAVVKVRIDSRGRDLIFDDVSVRVSPDFRLELHLDTDEANAAGIDAQSTARIVTD